MYTLIAGIQDAIAYIEENITKEITIKDIAEAAGVSEFYFQRTFTALCGFTVGEYIRNRRLTLAALEISGKTDRIIDIAVKYGYTSPEGFTKAFSRFHGVTPSAAREKEVKLRNFTPLKINILLEGGTAMDYKIAEKPAFTIMGRKKRCNTDNSYLQIPRFWNEHWKNGGSQVVMGMYGLCIDLDGNYFDYYIADNYRPEQDIPEGYEIRTLPGGTWAIFPCTLETLQDTNTKMWGEWLPCCREYKLGGNYNIEYYFPLCKANPQKSPCELWLPLEKV